MQILKFKKLTKGKYKLYLSNDKEVVFYEDVIVNNKLLLTKKISESDLLNYERENQECYIYNLALQYIEKKIRSTKEVTDFLFKKKLDSKLIDITIKKLKQKGVLNDFKYARAFINDKLLLSKYGPLKIKKDLIDNEIDKDIIDECIEEINEDIVTEKLSNLMDKQIRLKRSVPGTLLKVKLFNYFSNLGFDRDQIHKEISNSSIKTDILLLQKEYDKLYIKLSKKYDTSKLDNIILKKLYQKGFSQEDINQMKRD